MQGRAVSWHQACSQYSEYQKKNSSHGGRYKKLMNSCNLCLTVWYTFFEKAPSSPLPHHVRNGLKSVSEIKVLTSVVVNCIIVSLLWLLWLTAIITFYTDTVLGIGIIHTHFNKKIKISLTSPPTQIILRILFVNFLINNPQTTQILNCQEC